MVMKKKLKKVKLAGSRFSLEREKDGAGDSGALYPMGDKTQPWGVIKVGYSVFCGAWRTTMFGADTWWLTTPVTEILKVNKGKTEVRFKTGNSVYVARSLNHD